MPVTASGPISLPLENGRTLIANCAAFRTWTGTADIAAAKNRIHLVDFEPPENGREYTADELAALRPYAEVDEFIPPDERPGGDPFVSQRQGYGAFVDAGKLLVRFFDNVDDVDAQNPSEARLQFMNKVGAVIAEIKELGGGDTDLLSVHRITRWEPYRRSDESEAETMGDFYRCSFVLTWGP
jgi:hypothetical protein